MATRYFMGNGIQVALADPNTVPPVGVQEVTEAQFRASATVTTFMPPVAIPTRKFTTVK
jgi:hypothetical protein